MQEIKRYGGPRWAMARARVFPRAAKLPSGQGGGGVKYMEGQIAHLPMAQGSTLFEEVPLPDGKVHAAPVVAHAGETSNANLKEAFGRLVVFGIYSNDPMATLSPMMWLAIPLLKTMKKYDQYNTPSREYPAGRINQWKKDRDTAIMGWNTRSGMWKESKITAENTIADIMEVAITEGIIVITKSMWDISSLVAGGGPGGEEAQGGEPRI